MYKIPKLAAWAANVAIFFVYVYATMIPTSIVGSIFAALANEPSLMMTTVGVGVLVVIVFSIINTDDMYLTRKDSVKKE